MKKIIFATNNLHKLKEIRNAISDYEIISLNEVGINEEILETGSTLHENALEKAKYIYKKTNQNCFADDTGLKIEFLNGRPGVYSARYAGDDCSPEDNMNKVLKELISATDRKAIFKTVIALILDGKEYFFEGHVNGFILEERTGEGGFGYDPIFQPKGFNQSFAKMSLVQKNLISHRALAVKKLINFLNDNEAKNQ